MRSEATVCAVVLRNSCAISASALHQIGLSAQGGLFPVQTLRAIPGVDPERLYRRLLSFDVRAVLRSARHMPGAALSFLITVMHTRSDIGRCMDVLQHSCVLVRHERGKRDHALSRAGSGILA